MDYTVTFDHQPQSDPAERDEVAARLQELVAACEWVGVDPPAVEPGTLSGAFRVAIGPEAGATGETTAGPVKAVEVLATAAREFGAVWLLTDDLGEELGTIDAGGVPPSLFERMQAMEPAADDFLDPGDDLDSDLDDTLDNNAEGDLDDDLGAMWEGD